MREDYTPSLRPRSISDGDQELRPLIAFRRRRSGPGVDFYAATRRDRVDDFIRSHNGAGVVWEIDFEGGVQQIQIRVSETTGTPMLRGYDIAGVRFELGADLTAPCPVFEGLSRPDCLLNRREVLPGLVVACTVSPMQRIENADFRLRRALRCN